MKAGEWISTKVFSLVHGKNLVYNTCWEDPRLDRVALELDGDDEVLVITSAGCNALDYSLQEPRRVHCVDMNPRQNALLELKIAAIRKLDYGRFFQMFGQGRLADYQTTYWSLLRRELSQPARDYWDRKIGFFSGAGWRRSFYFYGTAGLFARLVNTYIDKVARVRPQITAIVESKDLDEQAQLYRSHIGRYFWNRFIRWAVGRDATLSLLGVPRAQRIHLESNYPGGIAKFMEDCIEAVFTKLPFSDNYFWRVYLTGEYSKSCCPEYLKEENYHKLRAGLVDRISIFTGSVIDFLKQTNVRVSRYVLLDHMDWLSTNRYPILELEWQWLLDRSRPDTRFLWRSGGLETGFVDRVRVQWNGETKQVGELLRYNRPLAAELHEKDRVHTYGSFHIAELKSHPELATK